METKLIELKEELNKILCYEPISSKRVLLISQEIDKIILEYYSYQKRQIKVS